MKLTREPAQSNILRSIAEAFERSAKPFSVENHRLANLSDIEAVDNPVPRYALAENVWIDFEANKGVSVSIAPGEGAQGVRLRVNDLSQSRWFSFSYQLDHEVVRSARYLGLLIRAGSSGIAAFRPCIRYSFDGSFQDRFAPQMLVFQGGVDEQLCVIKPDHLLLERATKAEVLFFFEGKKFDVTLLGIENLLI